MNFAFYTLGCKTNQYETQAMERLLTDMGHGIVPFEAPADCYIINTCSVSSSRPNNYQPTPYEEGSKEYNRAISKLDASYKGGNLPIG